MNKLISSIIFNTSIHKVGSPTKLINDGYIFQGDSKEISELSKINLMVGSNNSGKSRFIRQVFKINQLKFEMPPLDFDNKIEEVKSKLVSLFEFMVSKDIGNFHYESNHILPIQEALIANVKKRIYIKHVEQLISNLNSVKYSFKEGDNFINGLSEIKNEFVKVKSIKNIYNKSDISDNDSDIQKAAKETFGSKEIIENSDVIKQELLSILKEDIDLFSETVDQICIFKDNIVGFKKVYIPILRGLLPLSTREDLYASLIKKKYFEFESEDVEVFTGQNLYEEIMDMLLGDLDERELIKEFQLFLSQSFFDGQEVLIIPRRKENQVIYIKIGDEEEYPIYDLGDGIQALIILTFPLFKYRNENLLLFVEEPELNLHPGMQRKLIEILYSDTSRNTQFFMTTHSNHMLDMTLDSNQVSVYTFKKSLSEGEGRNKKSKINVVNVSSENNKPLELLGVKNSAVFLTNCTIWVEGITDRLYIRKYLEVYQAGLKEFERFNEDIHYSFVEYSGNNITHWSFLEEEGINQDVLCGTLFLISDLDGETKNEDGEWKTTKGARHEKLEKELKERYKCLECREIENLLSPKILEKVICEYEKVDCLNEEIITTSIKYNDYKFESLGKYIDNLLKVKNRTGSYASDSGTVSDKLNFCKKAISKIQNFEDLSEEAKELTKTLYNYIKNHN